MTSKPMPVLSVSILLALSLHWAARESLAEPYSLTVFSRAGIAAYGPLDYHVPPGDPAWGEPNPAVATWVHPEWAAYVSIPGATWVSTAYLLEPSTYHTWRWFQDTVELPADACDIQATLTVTADNKVWMYVNGGYIGVEDAWSQVSVYPLSLAPGPNTLDFIVQNAYGGSPYGNPTGLIYRVDVTYERGLLPVLIDIKPDSDDNTINLGSNGTVPVAILSEDVDGDGILEFNATQVDPDTVALAGADVAVRGRGDRYMASADDVNSDGVIDLLLHIETENLQPDQIQGGVVVLTGTTYDGQAIEGVDVCLIVPPG